MKSHVRQHGARFRSAGYADTVGRIAVNVRRLREERGWTQEQIAAYASAMSPRLYRQIEAGRTNLTAATLTRLAEALGVDVAALLAPAPPRPKGRPGRPRKRPRLGQPPLAVGATSPALSSGTRPQEHDPHPSSTQPREVTPASSSDAVRVPYSQGLQRDLARRVADRIGSYGAGSELDRLPSATHLIGAMEADLPLDPAIEAELLHRRLGVLYVALADRRNKLAEESARLDMTLKGLGAALPTAPTSSPLVAGSRVGTATVVVPSVPRQADLREFLLRLLTVNVRGLLSVEIVEAARTAGRPLGKNAVHALLHGMYESGDLTREGRRGSYVYRLREERREGPG